MSNSTNTQRFGRRVNPFIIKEINNGLDVKVNGVFKEGTQSELFSYLISFLKKRENNIVEIAAGNDTVIEVFKKDKRVSITIDSEYDTMLNVKCLKELLSLLNNIEVSSLSEHTTTEKNRNYLNGKMGNIKCSNTDKIYIREINKEDEVKAYKNNEASQSVKQEMRMCARRTSCDKGDKKYLKNIKDAYIEYSRENVSENDYVFAPLSNGKYVMLYEMVGYVKYKIVIPINPWGKKGKGKCYLTNNPMLTVENLIKQGIIENGAKVAIIKPHKA